MTKKKSKVKKRTKAEMLLDKVRREPSPTCNDPKQMSFLDYIRSEAFTDLT